MITDAQLIEFCGYVGIMRQAHYAKNYPEFAADYCPPLVFERGAKNARIIGTIAGQRSVFCFVRLEDGAILKAAGWRAPAKHARGNIANGAADVGPYGPAYLR